MYSHFISYLGFYSIEEDQVHSGAALHVVYHVLSIPWLLMPWRLTSPRHQQVWYWPDKLKYSISSIRVKYAHFNELGHHWFRSWVVGCSMSSYDVTRPQLVKIYIHFFIHEDVTGCWNPSSWKKIPAYRTKTISWLLMAWQHKEPGHPQTWHWH